jgi:hypothetical protein
MIRPSLSRFVVFAVMGQRVKTMSTAATKRTNFPIVDGPAPASKRVNFGWCSTASVQPGGDITIETIADPADTNDDVPLRTIQDRVFDLTQSVDWMEYLEHKENRLHDEGGAGAYDTMRCDVVLSPSSDPSNRVRIWGEDYHLNRLRNSYLSLLRAKTEKAKNELVNGQSNLDAPANLSRFMVDEALDLSRTTLRKLLSEAELSVSSIQEDLAQPGEDTTIQLFRVTLLWSTPSTNEKYGHILVRGHATSSCKPVKIHSAPGPSVVSVAAHTEHRDSKSFTIDKSLPTRVANPQSKIASWCRLRRKMETPDTYKPPGVSEVLMVRPRKDEEGKSRLEVLEGLSSNFFAIYKDGTLRTATEGVLNGYVRHLVLDCASKCGLKFDPRPVFLHETSEWKEAFITSSSRLVYPISKVLLPEDEHESPSHDGTSFVEYWNDEALSAGDAETETPKWQELLNEILKRGGYDCV